MGKKPIALTLDEDLIEFLREYAKENRTTISHIFNQYAAELKAKSSKGKSKK